MALGAPILKHLKVALRVFILFHALLWLSYKGDNLSRVVISAFPQGDYTYKVHRFTLIKRETCFIFLTFCFFFHGRRMLSKRKRFFFYSLRKEFPPNVAISFL